MRVGVPVDELARALRLRNARARLAVLEQLVASYSPRPKVPPCPETQLALWSDWPGWFRCPHLHCELFIGSCIARQIENERQLERRKARAGSDGDTARKRGKAPEYPLCQTSVCALGRDIRARVGDAAAGRIGPARLAAIGMTVGGRP